MTRETQYTLRHLQELGIEVLPVEEGTRSRMGGDNSDASVERTRELRGIGEFVADDRRGMFVAGVKHEQHSQFCRPPIEGIEGGHARVDSLDGRVYLHHSSAEIPASIQLLERI